MNCICIYWWHLGDMQMALSCTVEIMKHWTGKQWCWWIISECPEHPNNRKLCIILLQAEKLCYHFWLAHWNCHNHGQTTNQSEMKTDHFRSQSVDTKLAIVVDIATMVCFEGTRWEQKFSFSASDCCIGTAIILDSQVAIGKGAFVLLAIWFKAHHGYGQTQSRGWSSPPMAHAHVQAYQVIRDKSRTKNRPSFSHNFSGFNRPTINKWYTYARIPKKSRNTSDNPLVTICC